MEMQVVSTDYFLSFKLEEELFSANVAKVVEILEMTKVPKVPPYMRGVINLRGQVLPAIDYQSKIWYSKIRRKRKYLYRGSENDFGYR